MASGRRTTILRLVKPIVAGLALAYLVTAFVDKPASVHFQPENPFAAQQSAIIKPQAELVIEKNAMKLGSPLSVVPDQKVDTGNPLARLEALPVPLMESNATASPIAASDDNATPVVRGEIDTVPVEE